MSSDRVPPAAPQVIVMSGPLAGAVVEVGDKLSVGRRPENALRLRDDQVSRYHAVIERRGSEYVIEDLGSRTGTVVDGKLVERTAVLRDGSQLVIGQTVLQFNAYGEALQRMSTDPKPLIPPEMLREPVTDPAVRTLRDSDSDTARETPASGLPSIPSAIPSTVPSGVASSIPGPRPTTPEFRRLPPKQATPADTRNSSVITLVPVDRDPFTESLARKDGAELRRASQHLQTLLSANSIIASELDLEKLFEKILDQIFNALPAHRAVIMTKASETDPLEVVASRAAVGDGKIDRDRLVSHTIVDQAFAQRVGVLTLDAGADARFDTRQSVVDMNIRSAICVPMVHHDVVLGVIYLDTQGITHAFKEDDLRLLTGIAGPAAGAVKNALLVRKLRATAIDTILRLAIAAEYRDDDTGFHIHRMSDYAEAIARALGCPAELCDTLKLASPMHDVGKIGIADAILKKPGRLTKEEFEEMKLHTVKGGAILASSDSELLAMAEQIALTHHEKFDGSGYPRGFKGKDIPLVGRIVAVADVFDALTTKRCYKSAFSLEDAFHELTIGAGKHFDPEIIECFMSIRDRVLVIREHYLALEASETEGGAQPTMPTLLSRRPPPPPTRA